jgi:hypothetical protein
MSTVPPSPPWAMTRTSLSTLDLHRGGHARAHGAALANSECSHATRHEDSGYGVEKTSRQPVALATISRPLTARIAASRA